MKAIILTNALLNVKEKAVLVRTKIYKLALNHHAEEIKPDARIITDYVLLKICRRFEGKIVSVRDKLRCPSKRVEYFNTEFKGATIVAAIEYLISKNYTEILIVGDNSVNGTEFQNLVKTEIDKLSNKINIYQYKKGNFNLPPKSVIEFCKV